MDFLFNDSRSKSQKELDLSLSKSLQEMKKSRIKIKESEHYYKCVLCRGRFDSKEMIVPDWYVSKSARVCSRCYKRISKKR